MSHTSSTLSPIAPYLLASVRINQLTPPATAWLARVLTALDAKDIDAYTSFITPTCKITFNNGTPTLQGLDDIRTGLSGFWATFGTLRHEELNIYGTDHNFVHEALNYYTTLDGREVVLRAVAFVDRDEEGKMEAARIYSDQSPLWVKGVVG